MTPERLETLRASLPPFGAGLSSAGDFVDYLRLYRLDFSAKYPTANYQAGTVKSGQYSLMVHRWLQPGAQQNLLLVHGYFDHTGLYTKLIEYGLSRGCNVLIFDLPGHGLSSGDPAVIDDFSHYSRAIQDVLNQVVLPELPLSAIGQSTGCAALIQYARGHHWSFAKTVFLAPLVRPAGWHRVRAGHFLTKLFSEDLPRTFNENSSDKDFLDFIQTDPLQSHRIPLRWIAALKRWLASLPKEDLGVGPVLVVQGDQDGTVAWRYNIKVIPQLFGQSQLELIAGAGHQLANESVSLREQYYLLMDDYLGLRPVQSAPLEQPA